MILCKRLLFVFFLLQSWSSATAQTEKNVLPLESRVDILEKSENSLEQKFELKATELKQVVADEVSAKVKDIEETKGLLKVLIFFGLPLTGIGLLGVYFGAVKKARKLVEEQVAEIVEKKREELIKLIETQEYDTRLKEKKKLLVLSANEEANNSIKTIFDKFKFKYVSYRIVTEYKAYPEYDLIIFNDANQTFDQKIIDDYILNTEDKDISFVGFTTRQLTRNPRINFSNSSFTLYHNVLNTLRYTEILKIID